MNLVLQAFVLDAGLGHFKLFFGDGCRRNLTTVVFCGVNRKATPSGSNFENMVIRTQLKFFTNTVQFQKRSVQHGAVFVFKDTARVHHRLIEHKFEKVIAKVVVSRDVFLTAGQGVVAKFMYAANNGLDKFSRPPSIATSIR